MALNPKKVFLILTLSVLLVLMFFYVNIDSTVNSVEEEELIFLKPFVPLTENIQFASQHKVQGCGIAKSMSQLLFNTICYLNNTDAFAANNQTFSSTWIHNRTSCENVLKRYHLEDLASGKINLDEYIKFTFVRDPMDRFRSFYMDKCVYEKSCADCKDVLCAAKEAYRVLREYIETGKYVTKTMYFASHASPQTWNCEFGKHLHDYEVIRMGSTTEGRRAGFDHLAKFLLEGNVPEVHVRKIVDEAMLGETHHSTHGHNKSLEVMREIETNPELRKYLHHMYYYDYIAFGLDMSSLDESYRIGKKA